MKPTQHLLPVLLAGSLLFLASCNALTATPSTSDGALSEPDSSATTAAPSDVDPATTTTTAENPDTPKPDTEKPETKAPVTDEQPEAQSLQAKGMMPEQK